MSQDPGIAEILMHVDSDFIVNTLKNVDMLNQSFLTDALFNVDSRAIQPGEIFIALSGQKVDGHNFVGQALERGASGFILAASRKDELLQKYSKELATKSVLFVPDTYKALIDLARAWRAQFSYPVIGITGSVGKTTTKEMVRNILKVADLSAVVSSGNQNTMIGASLNILKMRPTHKVAVFELGISEIGSMKQLADLVRPTYAVITHIGHSHLAGLDDVATIAREKREIFSCFTEQDIGIINGDQPELSKVSYQHPVIRFGKKTINQIQARKIVCSRNTISFIVKIYNKRYSVVLPTCNEARVMNALAAMTIGHMVGVSDELLIKGVEQPIVTEGRFQMITHTSGATLINDAYNANPESMKASLVAFDHYMTDQNKIIVLGDMLELGEESAFWHRQIGRFLRKVDKLTQVILVGHEVEMIKKTLPYGIKCQIFAKAEDAYETLRPMVLNPQNVMLFKASRSMRFAELIKKLQA